MGVTVYLILSFLLFWLLSLNFQTYRYYHLQIFRNKELKRKNEIFDLFFAVLSLWPFFLFLAPLFNYTESCLFSALLFLLFYFFFLLYLEYKSSQMNRLYKIYRPNITDIIFIILVLSLMSYYLQQIEYGEVILGCLNLSLILLYLLILKHIKSQPQVKINSAKSLTCCIISVLNATFYYILWGFAFIYILFGFFTIFMKIADSDGVDTCMDTGVCKEGYVFDNCGDGKPCTITKEYCISNNFVWYEKSRSCNTRNNSDQVSIK